MSIKQYRKKPVVIEAMIWDNKTKLSDVMDFTMSDEAETYVSDGELFIKTLEGDMHASYGDYIIKGVNGEFYPCKPDIFEKSYEEVLWEMN